MEHQEWVYAVVKKRQCCWWLYSQLPLLTRKNTVNNDKHREPETTYIWEWLAKLLLWYTWDTWADQLFLQRHSYHREVQREVELPGFEHLRDICVHTSAFARLTIPDLHDSERTQIQEKTWQFVLVWVPCKWNEWWWWQLWEHEIDLTSLLRNMETGSSFLIFRHFCGLSWEIWCLR